MEDSEAAQEIEALRVIWPELQDRPHVWNSPAIAIPVCLLGKRFRVSLLFDPRHTCCVRVSWSSAAWCRKSSLIPDWELGQCLCVLLRVLPGPVSQSTRRVLAFGLEKVAASCSKLRLLETIMERVLAMLQRERADCRSCCSVLQLVSLCLSHYDELRTDLLGPVEVYQ